LYSDKGKAIYSSDLFGNYSTATFVWWGENTLNTPYKVGLDKGAEGTAIITGDKNGWQTATVFVKASKKIYSHAFSNGIDLGWSEYVTAEISSNNLQSKQNLSNDSDIVFFKLGKIVVAHIVITITSDISGYNPLKLGIIPDGFTPAFENRQVVLTQETLKTRLMNFTATGDVNLWNWSSIDATPSGTSLSGTAVYCTA